MDDLKRNIVPLSCIKGYNIHIKNAKVVANSSADGCANSIFASNGDIKAENCYFESLVTGDVYLSYGGTFINCEAYLSTATHAYCFYLTSAAKPAVVIGGRYRAYTSNSASGYVSAFIYAPSVESTAACALYGVSCPTLARSGYYQKNAILTYGGYITSNGLITALAVSASGNNTSIVGTIPLSK